MIFIMRRGMLLLIQKILFSKDMTILMTSHAMIIMIRRGFGNSGISWFLRIFWNLFCIASISSLSIAATFYPRIDQRECSEATLFHCEISGENSNFL